MALITMIDDEDDSEFAVRPEDIRLVYPNEDSETTCTVCTDNDDEWTVQASFSELVELINKAI